MTMHLYRICSTFIDVNTQSFEIYLISLKKCEFIALGKYVWIEVKRLRFSCDAEIFGQIINVMDMINITSCAHLPRFWWILRCLIVIPSVSVRIVNESFARSLIYWFFVMITTHVHLKIIRKRKTFEYRKVMTILVKYWVVNPYKNNACRYVSAKMQFSWLGFQRDRYAFRPE